MKEILSPRDAAVVRFLFARVLPFAFLGIGALLAYHAVRDTAAALQSARWPRTDGRVVSCGITLGLTGGRTMHTVRLSYSYVVGGTHYRGMYQDGSSNRADLSWAEQYPVGATIDVRYRPANPGESLLRTGVRGSHVAMIAGALLFLLSGGAMAIFLPRAFKATVTGGTWPGKRFTP